MNEISLCMIVKNEEDCLNNCLSSVHDLVDEIIIVDTGSTDKTIDIAKNYTDKIYKFKWIDDFSKARNYSFSKATKEYIFWLDADDIIEEKEREKFKEFKKNIDSNIDIYRMKYIYSKDSEGKPTLIQLKDRIYKRKNNYIWHSPIHEYITPFGKIKNTDIIITHNKQAIHDKERNMRIFNKMIKEGYKFNIREEYCYASEFFYGKKYEKAIELYEKFKDKYIVDFDNNYFYINFALIDLAKSYIKTKNYNNAIDTLLTYMKFNTPTPVCLNELAYIYTHLEKYDIANFWYRTSLLQKDKENDEYQKYLTFLGLGYTCYKQNNIVEAIEYNERAGKIYPNDETYLKNKKIYESKSIKNDLN